MSNIKAVNGVTEGTKSLSPEQVRAKLNEVLEMRRMLAEAEKAIAKEMEAERDAAQAAIHEKRFEIFQHRTNAQPYLDAAKQAWEELQTITEPLGINMSKVKFSEKEEQEFARRLKNLTAAAAKSAK